MRILSSLKRFWKWVREESVARERQKLATELYKIDGRVFELKPLASGFEVIRRVRHGQPLPKNVLILKR